jgi:outer membrane protein TolC
MYKQNRWIALLAHGCFLFGPPLSGAGQPVSHLSLAEAIQLAQTHFPVIRQKDLVRQTAMLTIDNLSKAFLPQFAVSGQATYQSDVTKINIPFPGFTMEPLSKDQYKLTGEASQLLYDGGITSRQKTVQLLNADAEEQQTAVELYRLRDRVNQLYLGVIFLQEQLNQAALVKTDLQTGINKTAAQVQNGVTFKSNLDVLKAEMLKAEQRILELKASKKELLETLGLLLGRETGDSTVLERPVTVSDDSTTAVQRPELKWYDAQVKLLSQQNKLIAARNLPRASVFVQGGYGRPGLNLLTNGFSFYYIGGLRLNWSLGGLYTSKKDKELVDVNKKMVDVQRETFLLNNAAQLKQQSSEIDKWRQLAASDSQIIALRESVKQAAKAQLENGVITANDYLREVNAEDQARQVLITHQVQLLQAQINYQTLLGK